MIMCYVNCYLISVFHLKLGLSIHNRELCDDGTRIKYLSVLCDVLTVDLCKYAPVFCCPFKVSCWDFKQACIPRFSAGFAVIVGAFNFVRTPNIDVVSLHSLTWFQIVVQNTVKIVDAVILICRVCVCFPASSYGIRSKKILTCAPQWPLGSYPWYPQ